MQINSIQSLSSNFGGQGRGKNTASTSSIFNQLSLGNSLGNTKRRGSRHGQSNIYQLILNLIIQLIKQLIDQLQNKQEPYRTFDGTKNNKQNPDQGSAGEALNRLIPKDSDREIGGVTEANLPSAREISNVVADQDDNETTNRKGLSDMFWLWGQFLDHDIDLSPDNKQKEANIKVPQGDLFFDPQSTGQEEIGFHRTNTITDGNGREVQPNVITAYIDGSNIYGSSKEKSDELRTGLGGRLEEGANGLLPENDKGNFVSGDVRVNENVGLSSMHTVWMREHNRVADKLSSQNPHWNDEKIFQESRKQVIGQMQAITYNEFLPQLLGKDKLGSYQGYDKNLSPQINNSFSTAAYRLGHTMLSPTIQRLDEAGNEIQEGHLQLRNAFVNPDKVREAGIDPILRGFASQTAQAVDPMIIDDVRNFLFGQPGQGGFDLAALNTQRGRDHGLSSLNDSREALGLSRITSFDDPAWQDGFGEKLAQVYDSPDEVDLWIGGLAEKHDGDSLVGSTFTEILTDQFTRLRSADNFWYEKDFNRRQVRTFNNTSLSDVIKRNTDIKSLQDNVLVAQTRQAPIIRSADGGSVVGGVNGVRGDLGAQAPELDAEHQQRIRNALESGLFG